MTMVLSKSEPNILIRVFAQLHLFDAVEGVFMLQDDNVTASVIETGTWECTQPLTIWNLCQIGSP